MSEETKPISVIEVYEEHFKKIYADLLAERLKGSRKRYSQERAVPNKYKSQLILRLIANMYEIPLYKLEKTEESYNQDDWLSEARGMLYHLHHYELKWRKKRIEDNFDTKKQKIKTCMERFMDRRSDHKSTKEKYNFIVQKLQIVEI